MKHFLCTLTAVCFFALCSCNVSEDLSAQDKQRVSIITWNVQTFFDSVETGSEYSDYRGSKSTWNEEKYKLRLDTLCEFIEMTQADVYVFQEIENSGILQDISNRLVGLRSIKKGYAYSCFSKPDGDALGMAIMSRYPLENISAHQVDFRVALGLNSFENTATVADGTSLTQPLMRNILHTDIMFNEDTSLAVYACHWKSKYGGAETSEIWRNAQERLLADLLLAETKPFIATGDFNRTLEEFMQDMNPDEQNDFLVYLQGSKKSIATQSAWLAFNGQTTASGSYYYQGEWEKIDHFFYSPNLSVVDFQTITDTLNTTEDGIPLRYELYSGKGVADHLPLLCVIELKTN
ncbi:MAG: endonuclease/exonuclease/phosphatase family protein [Spirochaetales bacterium]